MQGWGQHGGTVLSNKDGRDKKTGDSVNQQDLELPRHAKWL